MRRDSNRRAGFSLAFPSMTPVAWRERALSVAPSMPLPRSQSDSRGCLSLGVRGCQGTAKKESETGKRRALRSPWTGLPSTEASSGRTSTLRKAAVARVDPALKTVVRWNSRFLVVSSLLVMSEGHGTETTVRPPGATMRRRGSASSSGARTAGTAVGGSPTAGTLADQSARIRGAK